MASSSVPDSSQEVYEMVALVPVIVPTFSDGQELNMPVIVVPAAVLRSGIVCNAAHA